MKTLFKIFPAWILVVFLLVPNAEALPLGEREEWMGTYYQGKKLGFSHVKWTVTKEGVWVKSRIYIRMKSGGTDHVTSFSQETRLTPDLKLKSFSLLQEIMGHRQRIEGWVEGGKLKMEISTLDYKKKKTIGFPNKVAPSATLFLNILERGLKVGTKDKLRTFIEPFQMVKPVSYEILRKEKIKSQGREEEAFVIRQEYLGMESILYVKADGSVLKETTSLGFESVRESAEEAQALPADSLTVSQLITLSLIKLKKPLIKPYKKKLMKVKISHLVSEDAIPKDHRQTVLATSRNGKKSYTNTVVIKTEPAKVSNPAKVPVTSIKDKRWLEETSEIQSKHPMIRALAGELVKEKDNAWVAAKKINLWVYSNLEKALVDAFTALHALQERRGECQSHTNLFVALARAAGIPTKVVNGLVYSEDYKGFVYHAWPEVYVGEWRALDPTFGQEEVDATHIKLSEGSYEGTVKLMEFIGKVQLELIEN